MFPRSLPAPRTPDSQTAPPLRWGILGTGWIAEQFVRSLRKHTRQVVQAVGSRALPTAQRAADRWGGATAYGSYAGLVSDPRVDVVYVATPHHLHLPHALLAIQAGKHVLVEKPLGLSADEARTIHHAAQTAKVFCMEALWTLCLPKYDVIRQLLTDGVLGEPTAVLADIGETFTVDHRILRVDLAGGPLLDLGTYPVTLATWVLGDPDIVQAVGTPAATGVNGQLAITLHSPTAVAALHTTLHAVTPTTAVIAGTKATISIERFFYRPGPFALTGSDGARLEFDEPAVGHDALHFEAAEVARCITAGETGSPLRPMADTARTLAVMDRIRKAVGITFDAAIIARG